MKKKFSSEVLITAIAIVLLFVFISCGGKSSSESSSSENQNSVSDTPRNISSTQDTLKFPKPNGWVNDFENDLDNQTKSTLINLIEAHQKKTTNQIAVVTIASYVPYDSLASFSKALANEWGIGLKDKNNGVLITFSKAEHQVRISTGLGTEAKLPDELCQKICNEKMIPYFQASQYGEGLIEGVKEIIRILEN